MRKTLCMKLYAIYSVHVALIPCLFYYMHCTVKANKMCNIYKSRDGVFLPRPQWLLPSSHTHTHQSAIQCSRNVKHDIIQSQESVHSVTCTARVQVYTCEKSWRGGARQASGPGNTWLTQCVYTYTECTSCIYMYIAWENHHHTMKYALNLSAITC